MQATIIIVVFVLTYAFMAAGRLPWLRVDRTGIALFGLIALIGTKALTLDDVGANTDTPTLVLLFALMIISAQFAAAGVYDRCALWMTERSLPPALLLGLTVAVCGGLSALLANDILVLALVPLVIAGVQERGLDPRPFVIAVALATNAGSAATIIGNPQNILIGEIGNLGFLTFLAACGLPAAVSLVLVFVVTWLVWRGHMVPPEGTANLEPVIVTKHPFDRFQMLKGVAAILALIFIFMVTQQHEIYASLIAAFLLASRKFTSRTMIAAVDWPLLLLFACLFGITGALADTGIPWGGISVLQEWGLMPDSLLVLTPLTLLMSNTIGNVPSTILLMQIWPNPPKGALYGLALLSSLAGNLLVFASLTNIMVVERANAFGVRLSVAEHARVGIPVTILSMAFAVIWLAWMEWLPWLPESWSAQ
jgi:Na+/H+ antiporter NhaD/arsenite permease-like protein